MKRTRLSLFYLAGYLIPIGFLLLFAPTFTLRLLLSNGDYGSVFPRVVGMLLIGIGAIVVQIIRFRIEIVYSTTLLIRAFFCLCFTVFFFTSHDPFFLVLITIVAIGLIWTALSYVVDKQQKSG
jgi:hypothetical protein